MLIIAKFGGSIISDEKGFLAAAEIIKEMKENRIVVVLSAMQYVTNTLINFVDNPSMEAVEELTKKHLNAVDKAIENENIKERTWQKLSNHIQELKKMVSAISVMGDTSPRTRDYIISFGERLSTTILSAVLEDKGVNSIPLMGGDAGIITNDKFGDATPDFEKSKKKVNENLTPLLDKNIVPVVSGFIGMTEEGHSTTIGRGGSDYTATILASFLEADEVQLYTDVAGIMTANPSKINNTNTIPNIDLNEALEMAYIGAKKFHPRTFEPLLEKDTIIRIKSIWEREKGGTIISQKSDLSIKAVAVIDELSILSVVGPGMVGRRGTAAEVFKVVSEADVNIITISQPASESTISFAIKNQHADMVRNKLLKEFKDRRVISDVIEMKNVASVVIVGNALKNNHDEVGLVMREATHHNILSASWSPTGMSITFVLVSDAAWSLAERLHDNVIRG